MEKIQLIVIDNHTLGYLIPNSTMAGILHTSVLKGSTLNQYDNVETKEKNIRLASKKDFEDFRVSFEGYENSDEYLYDKTH